MSYYASVSRLATQQRLMEKEKNKSPSYVMCGWFAFTTGNRIRSLCPRAFWKQIYNQPSMTSIFVGCFTVASSFGSYVTKASWCKTEKIQNKYHIMRHHQNHYRGIEIGSTFHQRARSYVVNTDSGSPPLLWALSIHFLVGTAYSIDDIPDNEGDDKFGIQSLSVHLGQKRVFLICVSLFEMIYRVAILVGATSSYHWCKMITTMAEPCDVSIWLMRL
ncbi:uncharacterized protein LOC106771902 [Vigna radiata var. radiata]|uniref:Uncharacterized protein LOC106771902 n=1 Tax=Vigna radiata var. radiata TaxID=3916 RepID=A0A1S3V5K5_VIGRR|nr:uncharacterized protein LOC106771902 [Vigna radiata var. radiata]